MKNVLCITLIIASACVGAIAEAQQISKIPRIAFLAPSTITGYAIRIAAFRRGLRNLGYVEGKNISIEYRYTDGKSDRVSQILAELIGLNVDVIVTSGTTTVLRAKKATKTIPIFFVGIGDPIGNGIIDNLARPGWNLTGPSNLSPGLGGKRLELLKDLALRPSRVAVLLWNPEGPGTVAQMKEFEVAAPALHLTLQRVEVQGPGANDLEIAFSTITKGRSLALIASQSPTFGSYRGRIAEFAVTSHQPVVYGDNSFSEAGGLVSYGASSPDLFRSAATYVDKVLKGANPASLPVEQPTKFELVINLKTAKQIGLTIPPNALARADRVIR